MNDIACGRIWIGNVSLKERRPPKSDRKLMNLSSFRNVASDLCGPWQRGEGSYGQASRYRRKRDKLNQTHAPRNRKFTAGVEA